MCLTIPGKIIKIENSVATIDYGAEKRLAGFMQENESPNKDSRIQNFSVGDYVMVMGKIVVQKIPEEEAKRSLQFYSDAVEKEDNENI